MYLEARVGWYSIWDYEAEMGKATYILEKPWLSGYWTTGMREYQPSFRSGCIARGYNISPEIIQLNLKPLRQFANVIQVNLAEEEIIALSAGEDRNLMIPGSGDENASIMFSSGANKM